MSDRDTREPDEPVVAEPKAPEPPVEPVPAEPVAPIQVAPEPGAAPVVAEPERAPVVAEPEPAAVVEPEPATAHDPGPGSSGPAPSPQAAAPEPARTDETLALPPTTSVDPPQSSQPEPGPVHQGVPVPFAAPPTERNSGRFATGLVLGILGGVVFVAGVIGALGFSLFALSDSIVDRVETTAEDFVTDLSEEDWNGAYDALCSDLKDRPVEDYIDEWRSWDTEGAEVRGVRDEMSGTYVTVELADGSTVELLFVIEQDEAMETSICGWEQSL